MNALALLLLATHLVEAAGPDPCHDFYQYACGAWLQGHPIPRIACTSGQPAICE